MRTGRLRINQLSPDGYAWYLAYLEALDRKDIEAYGEFLADDVVLQMNNDEPVHGLDHVKEGLSMYWQSFGDLEHDLLNIYGSDSAFCLEALNHYSTLGGEEVTLRAVAMTDRNADGLVTSVRLYTDVSPLFA